MERADILRSPLCVFCLFLGLFLDSPSLYLSLSPSLFLNFHFRVDADFDPLVAVSSFLSVIRFRFEGRIGRGEKKQGGTDTE